MADLLDDDEVAEEVASIITDRTIETVLASAIDLPFVSGAIEDAATGPLTDAVGPVVRAVVRSEVGAAAWATAVAAVHDDVVAILHGDSTTLVDGSTIRIDLAPLADQIASRVSDALGPLAALGIGDALDVDLEIVLYDLSEHDTSLDIGSLAERLRVLTVVVAIAAASTLVATGTNRAAALVAAGGAIILAAIAFRGALSASEPDGLTATWAHVAETADGATSAVIAVGVSAVLVGAAWLLATSRRRSDAVSDSA